MPNTRSSSHRKLFIVIIAAVAIIVLSMMSAFVWPGWALSKQVDQSQQQQVAEPTKPSIDAAALPKDATELLKAMPDSVLNYARTKADASETWKSA